MQGLRRKLREPRAAGHRLAGPLLQPALDVGKGIQISVWILLPYCMSVITHAYV